MRDVPDLPLRKFVAPEIVFGPGARHLAGRYARNFGIRKVLVVTDSGVIQAGWAGDVLASLERDGVGHAVFSSVTPNPRAEQVARGADLYTKERCSGLVAVGGGSPMDCAKGIGIVSSNGRPILSFVGVDRVPVPMPPLLCVPTTGGSSADVSQFAIIADARRKVKRAIISKAVVPDVALIDPETLTSMSPHLAACTGMDALVHAVEAYVSNAHSPLTDVHALEAIRRLSSHLVASVEDPGNVDLKAEIMLGSLHAGMAFSNASLGAVHAMAHSLGGFLDLPHGECNALLFDSVLTFNFAGARERYREIALALGIRPRGGTWTSLKRDLLAWVRDLKRQIGVSSTLASKGVVRSDLPALARKASQDPCIVTNPRALSLRDIERMYEEAL